MPGYHPRMTDGQRAPLGRTAIVAIGFAVVALLTSVIAVVVVMRRRPEAVVVAPAREDRAIEAAEILKLKRDVVEMVATGAKIKDAALRTSLGLEPDDVVTAINGRAIKREFDVFDAVLGMAAMNATIIYVEVTRAGAPRLLHWRVEGDLRTTRHDVVRRPTPSTPNPFTSARDPVVDSITKLDDLHFEAPRASRDQLLANPDILGRQARIVPAMANGQPLGFKLYAVRPNTVWSELGLQTGDTLRSVNGRDLSTPDLAQQLVPLLKDATELQILVLRRDRTEQTIVITLK